MPRSPRDKTLRHMRRLLTFATAMAGPAVGCTGYGVVDPLPPPPKCRGLTASLQGRATFADGVWIVSVDPPTMEGAAFASPLRVVGGTPKTTATRVGAALVITIPDAPPTPTEVTTYVDMTCPAGVERVGIVLRITSTDANGSTVVFEDSY